MGVRSYLTFGRTFGACITFSLLVLGALSVLRPPLGEIVLLVVLGTLAHMGMGGLHEWLQRHEDGRNKDYAYKPSVNGDISDSGAKMFVSVMVVLTLGVSTRFFGLMTTSLLIAAMAIGMHYTTIGKYRTGLYEWENSIATALLVLGGAYAVGQPTTITFISMSLAAVVSAYGQFVGGFKDANADRDAGVKSLAISLGFVPGRRIARCCRPAMTYLAVLFILFDFAWCIGAIVQGMNPLLWIPAAGLMGGAQAGLVAHFGGQGTHDRLRVNAVATVLLSLSMGYLLVVSQLTYLGVIVMVIMVVGWFKAFDLAGVRFSSG